MKNICFWFVFYCFCIEKFPYGVLFYTSFFPYLPLILPNCDLFLPKRDLFYQIEVYFHRNAIYLTILRFIFAELRYIFYLCFQTEVSELPLELTVSSEENCRRTESLKTFIKINYRFQFKEIKVIVKY